jgi:Tol biopolymer transport system component
MGFLILAAFGCNQRITSTPTAVPPLKAERWGIYTLNLSSQDVELLYSTSEEIMNLSIHPASDRIAFSQKVEGDRVEDSEIFSIGLDGQGLQRLTNNRFLDTYPTWSPDGTQIAYLAWPRSTLDIYLMEADGSQTELLYDSGDHDADIHWVMDLIVFTRNSQVWVINADGSGAHQLTDPPRAGEWGNSNLPFGDYDPRLSPDGSLVVFERLVDDDSPNGNYDLFSANIDGTSPERITETSYSQGLASWSPSGNKIVYIVAAKDDVGVYDLYLINPDGTENQNITPISFPQEFLVHWATFSSDESVLYFIGEWWSD